MEKKYFYGNEISEYGIENGYVDYRTLAKCFEGVMCNNIASRLYDTLELESGGVDNFEEIEELQNKIEELELEMNCCETTDGECNEISDKIEELQDKISDLENESEPEIYQWFIVDDNAKYYLEMANEYIYYDSELDVYVWGVTHFGTSWDYVLTDIKIEDL